MSLLHLKSMVYIGGCPRSGTTMLATMLGGGNGCVVTPESEFKSFLWHPAVQSGSDFLDNVRRHWKYASWGLNTTSDLIRVDSPCDAMLQLVDEYAKRIQMESWQYWIDHTPANIQFVHRLTKLYPNARFIHIVRDPRGTIASVLPLPWGPYDVIDAASWWLSRVSCGLAAEHQWPDRVIRVRYEDILEHPEVTTQKLCAFLQIPWNESMVHGGRFNVPAYTRYQHGLVGKPVHQAQATAWKQRLTERQIEIIEDMTGGVMAVLGYPLVHDAGTVGVKPFEFWHCRMQRVHRFIVQRLKYKLRKYQAL